MENQDDLTEIFGPVIFAYTDQDALEDGVLVAMEWADLEFRGRVVNRMTRSLWDKFLPFFPGPEPESMDLKALRSALKTKLAHAGFEGGIWQVPPGLWLMENELGGYTLMQPSDY